MDTKTPRRILLEQEVRLYAPLGRATRWRLEAKGEFPLRVRLSTGRIGYYEDEILAWQNSRPRGTDSAHSTPLSPGRNGHAGNGAT